MKKRNDGLFLIGGLAFSVVALFTGSVVLAVSVEHPRYTGYGTTGLFETAVQAAPVAAGTDGFTVDGRQYALVQDVEPIRASDVVVSDASR